LVKRCFQLPVETSTDFIRAPRQCGGLGVPSLRLAGTQDALVSLSGSLEPGSQSASASCVRVLCEEVERC
ncbi:hypothetical protein T12_8651, partial [Trichinella patagoniensis]